MSPAEVPGLRPRFPSDWPSLLRARGLGSDRAPAGDFSKLLRRCTESQSTSTGTSWAVTKNVTLAQEELPAEQSSLQTCLLFLYDMPPAYSTNRNQPADLDDSLHNHQSDDDMDGVETHSDKQPPLLNLRAISQQKHLSHRSSLQLPPLDGSPNMRQLGLAAAIQLPQSRGPTHRNMLAPSSSTKTSPSYSRK
ncbi:hypothetical protein BC834DRAFT_848652 [Gloeopeniophorella convolvens]|nr:hypothetical protein BC834DRAFT_848652 [Gloeopeniophorella convolvens]